MKGVSHDSVTFAEAYRRRRQEKQVETKRLRRETGGNLSQEEMDVFLQQFCDVLQEGETVGQKEGKSMLNEIPECLAGFATNWTDNNRLDILHHCILNNMPQLVEKILFETPLFPPTHQPQFNPYAHLAATLGHKACLKSILINRPGDFFEGSKPSHAIRLPEALKRKLKLMEPVKGAKGLEKIMEKIKTATEDAEKMIGEGQADDTEICETLVKKLQDSEKKDRRRKVLYPDLSAKIISESPTHTSVPRPSASLPESGIRSVRFPRLSGTRSDMIRRHSEVPVDDSVHPAPMPSQSVALQQKHRIHVHLDILSEFDKGVIKGAGKPVQVLYSLRSGLKDANPAIRNWYEKSVQQDNGSFTPEGKRRVLGSKTVSMASDPNIVKAQSNQSFSSDKMSRLIPQQSGIKAIDLGIRGKKKYKEFHLKLDQRPVIEADDAKKYMKKTPLTLAAERGHISCVQLILDLTVLKNNPMMVTKEPLTLAVKARSPEAVLLLLNQKFSRVDYHSAVLMSIRELYPDCLSVLLTVKGKERGQLFDGTNIYHVLYSQSLISHYRYELMPEMTRVLVASKEDVNDHNIPLTFPMYTLISCAFNITIGSKIFFYIECLEMLLSNKANPHLDEEKTHVKNITFSRQPFRSAINCVFSSAKNSVNFFESSYWSKVFMKKIISTIESKDRTARRILNDVLFDYMDCVCELGLDKSIVRALLRYGGNPDAIRQGTYAINIYFDKMLPYLTKFEVVNSYEQYKHEIETLMLISRYMSQRALEEALNIFMEDHMFQMPIQALSLCRFFVSRINEVVRSPRRLVDLASLHIWLRLRRNKLKAQRLPIPTGILALIVP